MTLTVCTEAITTCQLCGTAIFRTGPYSGWWHVVDGSLFEIGCRV